MSPRFAGSWVALATPFVDGAVDREAFAAALARQRAGGSAGVVVAGTTGEGPTLGPDDRATLYAEAERAGLPWLASVGTSATRTTLALAEHARRAGAHGLLVAPPAYSRPSPRGLLAHFGAVCEATPLPVVLYDVPGRTAVELGTRLALELAARHPNVVAIKEASGSLEHLAAYAGRLPVLWGEDASLAEALERGAAGAISVLGNVLPALLRDLIAAPTPALAARLAPWNEALYRESNPGPLKAVLAALGLARNELRPPLAPVEPDLERELRELVERERGTLELEERALNANEERADTLLVEDAPPAGDAR